MNHFYNTLTGRRILVFNIPKALSFQDVAMGYNLKGFQPEETYKMKL